MVSQRITSDLDQCLRSLNGDYTTSGGGVILSFCTNLALALAATASCVKAAGAGVTGAMCVYVALVLLLNGWVNAAVPPWVRRVEKAEVLLVLLLLLLLLLLVLLVLLVLLRVHPAEATRAARRCFPCRGGGSRG